MKAKFVLAIVLCVAAAAIFTPIKAEEEASAAKLDGEQEVEATGTQLEQDPSDGVMRGLYGRRLMGSYYTYSKYGSYYGYHSSKHGYYSYHNKKYYYGKPYYISGHKYLYYAKYYKKDGHTYYYKKYHDDDDDDHYYYSKHDDDDDHYKYHSRGRSHGYSSKSYGYGR